MIPLAIVAALVAAPWLWLAGNARHVRADIAAACQRDEQQREEWT